MIKLLAVVSILSVCVWCRLVPDGLLHVTLGPLPIGSVSWSFRGREGFLCIFLINVSHTLVLVGTERRAWSMLGKRSTLRGLEHARQALHSEGLGAC